MDDFEILGAGPAGCYAANALAKRGYSVHLVDPATFPRDKLCGGGLTRKSLDLIESLEPSFRSTGLAEFVRELYLVSPDTHELRSTALAGDCLALVRRRAFDAWWLGRAMDAGAEFAHEPSGAKFVVAADGVSSELGRRIRGPFRNSEVAVATEAMGPGTRRPFVAIALPSSEMAHPWGYSWLFGRSDGVAVGTGFRRDQNVPLPPLRDRIVGIAHRFGIREVPSFSNWVVPLYRPRPAARDNIALVGDALGTADPLLVEGIAGGMMSAKILVESFERHHDFSGYTDDLTGHPYFHSMKYLELLQRVESRDPWKAFRVVSRSFWFDHISQLLFDSSAAASVARLFALRHPLWALRTWATEDTQAHPIPVPAHPLENVVAG